MPSVYGEVDRPPRKVFNHGPRFPKASRASFADFNNKYQGRACYIVGRGPTEFHYPNLADVTDPILFINDAICLEKYALSETFFFAHDIQMRAWLDGQIKATAVLPIEGGVLGRAPQVVLNHAGPLVYYHRKIRASESLLRMTRDEIAQQEELFVHTGTIHSALHFIWFCGFSRVVYVGCDGINQKEVLARTSGAKDGYDARLQNLSNTSPGWKYNTIREAQDLLTTFFGLEAIYLGTPAWGRF